MATAVKRLDLAVGELVEIAGRRYEVVPDREGGVTIEPPITPVAQLHARRGTKPASAEDFERLSADVPPSSGYHAPVAIFPLCAEDIVDLLMGFMDYTVVLRVEKLLPMFSARRIDVKFARGKDANTTFLHARRNGATITVPAQLREQMLRELMSVDTLVAIVDTLLTRIQRGAASGPGQLVFCDERASWPSPPVCLAA